MSSLTWNGVQGRIEAIVPDGGKALVVVRLEGTFVKRVEVADTAGTTVKRWTTCPIMPGDPPSTMQIPMDTDDSLPGIAGGTYYITAWGELNDCPPTNTPMLLTLLQQTQLTTPLVPGEKRTEGMHFHFQIMVGETVHITIIVEPGAGGGRREVQDTGAESAPAETVPVVDSGDAVRPVGRSLKSAKSEKRARKRK